MDLTPQTRMYIDDLSYIELLDRWRFAPAGDRWFQGETGIYWKKRIAEMRAQEPDGGVGASKRLGWKGR